MSMKMDIKVMYLNPIGTSAYDEVFADMARRYKYPETTVHVTSLSGSAVSPAMTNLEYRAYEACIFNETVKAARYCSMNDYDALVVGCFYDPACWPPGKLPAIPSMSPLVRHPLAPRSTWPTISPSSSGSGNGKTKMKQAVYDYGGREKLVSFEAVDLRVEEFHQDPRRTRERLERAAYRAVAERRAKASSWVVRSKSASFANFRPILASRLSAFVPVIDPSIAALKAAENAALAKRVGWANSRVWGMQPPPERELADFGLFRSTLIRKHAGRGARRTGRARTEVRSVVPCTHYLALSTLCPGIDTGA